MFEQNRKDLKIEQLVVWVSTWEFLDCCRTVVCGN